MCVGWRWLMFFCRLLGPRNLYREVDWIKIFARSPTARGIRGGGTSRKVERMVDV